MNVITSNQKSTYYQICTSLSINVIFIDKYVMNLMIYCRHFILKLNYFIKT